MKENLIENTNKEKLGLIQLPKILEFLRSQGMEIAVKDIENANKYLIDIGHSLPLVRDGLDGIRASYSKRNDDLDIWFTNGFENPKNEVRLKIEKWLSDNYI